MRYGSITPTCECVMPCQTDPDDYRCSNDTLKKKFEELTQLLCSIAGGASIRRKIASGASQS